MKEYIKKFETAESADNYAITDIPFTTTISGETPQNLRCNEADKKLVNNNGVITVEDSLNEIEFTIITRVAYYSAPIYDVYPKETHIVHALKNMTLSEFVDNSDYNTLDLIHNESVLDGYNGFVTEDELNKNWQAQSPMSSSSIVSENTIITEGSTFYYLWKNVSCLLGDTLVTMSDSLTKQIKDIELGDKILSLDLTTGEQVARKVVFTDAKANKVAQEWDEWEFSDGTIVKTAHRHEFYNVEAGRFKYMDEWNIGEHTYKLDGTTPELIKHTVHEEVVNHYKITLEGSNNFFANGLLTGDRYCNNLEINLQNVD